MNNIDSKSQQSGLLRGTSVVSALTLLSRLLGFVRDLLVARLIGATAIADAYFVAFRIPNLLRSFVAEGALTSAFVPIFTASMKEGLEKAQETLREVTGFLVLLTTILTAVGILFAPQIVGAMAPGFKDDPAQFALCVQLTQVMMPYIMCISIIAMVSSALNAAGIFGTAAWAQVWMNIVLILGAVAAVLFDASDQAFVLSWSVLIGGAVQLITQLPRLRHAGLSIARPAIRFGAATRELLLLMLPAVIGASIYQISIFIATILASLLESGAVSWLFYADRVAQLPVGVFSVALASVLLPSLSRAHSSQDQGAFQKSLVDSLRFTSFLILPLSAGIFALALPISILFFQRGAFSADDARQTSVALQALALGLWASSCHSMLVRTFIARKDTLTPTLIGLATFATNVVMALILMGLPDGTHSGIFAPVLLGLQQFLLSICPFAGDLGHVGLALATTIAAYVSLSLVVLLASRRDRTIPWGPVVTASWKSLIAAAVMTCSVRIVIGYLPGAGLQVGLGTIVGAVVFSLVLLALRSTELAEALALTRQVFRRFGVKRA